MEQSEQGFPINSNHAEILDVWNEADADEENVKLNKKCLIGKKTIKS